MTWLVRIYRYDGSDSTVATYDTWKAAEWHAAKCNLDTQSNQYRAEEYDPEKAKSFWIDCKKAIDELPKKETDHEQA